MSEEPARLGKCVPNLHVASVAKALEYYRGALGFALDWDDAVMGFDHMMYASISRDEFQICLSEHEGDGGTGSVWGYVSDVHALAAELRASGAIIDHGPRKMPWGDTQIQVRDPDGNILCFNQPPTR